ncbi:MAG: DUF1624 domain-containing protein [Lachnospiraceae bacterium]|nr:DUF1624 domain-containing protein [Lachnospiraceae bacterium]
MRLAKIDAIRGITLISMILYHAAWDIVYIFGHDIPWYRNNPGFIWQQSICWTFILLSGFSWSLGKRHLKRGLTVFLCGAVITLATALFMPEDVVWFGILTFMGSAMLLTIPLDKYFRIRSRTGGITLMICAIILFFLTRDINTGYLLNIRLPQSLYSDYFTAFLGFPPAGFFSTDYFSLIPWFFLYLAGYSLYFILPVGNKEHPLTKALTGSICPPLEFIGKHTLIIYMLHQPVIYGVMMLISSFRAF